MPDSPEPSRTVAAQSDQSPARTNATDETTPRAAAAAQPTFGPPAAPDEVGTLGPYRLVKQLGAGGMGAVYLATDTRLGRKLALKVMLPEFAADPGARERFLREARAAAQISHDNVVTVYEADERDGVPYIAMQFLQGYPLDDYLRNKGAPALAHVIRIAREAALGLAAAHELGLVHRDIKPANLWLEAPNGRVKVLDFGLAKPIGSDAELTKSGVVVGTPAYMSPEQARGQKVDHRTDLFSLGAVLYRLCTGQLPFDGPNVMAVLMALGSDDPTPVRELNPAVPESLAQLIHQLLTKKPDARPQTAAEVAKRLRGILDQLLHPSAPVPEVPMGSSADVSTSLPVVVNPVPVQPPIVVPMQVTAAPESAFAGLGDDEPEPADADEPRERTRPERKPSGGKGLLVGVVGAVLLAGAVVAVVVSQMGKKGAEPDTAATDTTPAGAEKGKPGPAPKPKDADALPPLMAFEYKPVAVGASPFDKLDPNEIPKEERFDWQPKELVAVIGQHERRHWTLDNVSIRVAVSADGRWAASGSGNLSDRFVHVYDLKTHKTIQTVRADRPFDWLTFSPDGGSIWVTTEQGVHECKLGDTKFAPVPEFAKTPVKCYVTVSHQHKIVLLQAGPSLQVWDATGGKLVLRKALDNCGAFPNVSENGKAAYWLARKAEGEPWNLELVSLENGDNSRRVLMSMPPDFSLIWLGNGFPMCVSPNGISLAVLAKSGDSQDCTVYDLTTDPPRVKSTFKWNRCAGHIQFSPDGKTLCRRQSSTTARMDVTTNPPRPLEPIFVTGAFAFSPDGNTVVGGDGPFIRFFDVSGEKPTELDPLVNPLAPSSPHNPEYAPLLAPGKGLLAGVAYREGGVLGQMRDLTGTKPRPWPNEQAADRGTPPLHGVTPDGTRAVVDGTRLAKWTPNGFEVDAEPLADTYFRPFWTENGFTLSQSKPPKLWNLADPPQKARELPGIEVKEAQTCFAARADGALVVLRGSLPNDSQLEFWNLTGEKPRRVAALTGFRRNVHISPDGRWLVITQGHQYVAEVYDLSGKQPKRSASFDDKFRADWATFSPDARFVYVGGDKRDLAGYELATGEKVWSAKLPGASSWLQMAPDGRHLFTHNANGTIYVLRLPDPVAATAPDRKAAEWVLSIGGKVTLGSGREVSTAKDLPAGAFRVEGINLAARNPTAEGLVNLRGLSELKVLQLNDNLSVGDDAMPHLQGLTNLEHLQLSSTRVTGAGLAHLKNLTKMKELILDGGGNRTGGPAHFTGMKQLQRLELGHNNVTDADIAHLAGLDKLTHLGLLYTKVTAAGVEKLAKALPGCKIIWDGGTIEPKK
jgi:serine/threonine protein kinase/WD40 repeat protein